MHTVYTTDPVAAAEFIRNGGVVAFPTETVYGLGANVLDSAAVAKIFKAKLRPADNPLIIHIADRDQIHQIAREVTGTARLLMDSLFPGPLTVIVSKSKAVPDIATGGLDTVGVRMPRLDIARRFLESCGVPVAAPSANLSGRPSPTTWQAVAEDLDGRIDCILQGGATEFGVESTVVDCSGSEPVILRAGSISIEQLRGIVPNIRTSAGGDETKRSPGTRHRHYKPAAKVVIIPHPDGVERSAGSAYIGIAGSTSPFDYQLVCTDADQYARSFYEFLRECDRRLIGTIYCQEVDETGIGAALMDRMRRAAE